MKPTQLLCLASSVLALLAGCLDTASNPDNILPPIDQDQDPSGGDGDGDNASGDGDGTSGDGDGTPGDDDGDGDSTPGDGDGDADGDDSQPVESQIDGTAESAMCGSASPRTASTCYGYYCGVSEEMVAAELSPTRKCQLPADMLCAGTVSQKVTECAPPIVQAAVFNGDSDETIRTKIQACIYEDQAIKAVASEECISCYVEGAMCSKEHCTFQCVQNPTSSGCDACRMQNNCNQPVPGCAQLPDPF
jgi:hypothetical protein